MKITEINACVPEEARAPGDWRGWFAQILVQVHTEDGLCGYGIGGGGEAGVHVIQTALRSVLLGEDATDVEVLWERMYRSTLAFGRKGIAIMAISGVDLALWDLRGKRQGKSVAELLGGVAGSVIPRYLTSGIDEELLEPQARVKSYKLGGLGRFDVVSAADELVERLRAVHQALGEDAELMADAGMGWTDPLAVLALCEKLVELNLGWLEEPLPADDFDSYAWLRARSPVPIAGGEHEFTAGGFEELMRRGCHDIYQPDICWCGGMTEMVKVYALAKRHSARICPHRGSETWGLHAVTALDDQPLAESGRPWMEWVGGVEVDEGTVRTLKKPGFGVDFAARFQGR